MWNLVLFVSRAYFLRLLAVFILLAAPVVQAQQVTFQGAIERPAGAFATEAVSGEIEFKFLFGESVYEPFTIPANNSKTAYSKIIPLSQEQIDNVFVSVYARCRTNCETSNISTEIPYISPDDEQYGVAGGNNSYIANLTLPRKNNYLSGWITLPNNLVADSDIEIELIADSTAVRGYDNYLVRERQTVVIEQGQSSVKFSLPYDRRLRAYYNWFTVGYNCSSLSCEDHALTEYGWLTNLDENRDSLEVSSANHRLSDNSLHISPPGSGYYLGGMAAVDDEKGWYALLDPIVMLQNLSLPVTVKRDRLDKDPSNIINGRIQSYKKYTRLYCWGFSGDIYLFEGNGTCINPVYGNESKVLSESKFTIDANELTGEVLVNVEPLEQAEIPAEADQAVDDLDHQYFAFVCDEGCNDFDPDQVGYYLGSNSIFSGTNLASAHKFNFTNEFYESQIVIPLARFKGFPWLFELLEE